MHVVLDIDTFDVDAVHFCERNSGMFNQTFMSVLHETWDSLGVENCQF